MGISAYKTIRAADVPRWIRETCEQAASEAARALGIQTPALRWKTNPRPREHAWVNFSADDEINLCVDALARLTPAQVRAVMFHEAYHAYAFQRARNTGEHRRDERDAESFSYRHTRTLIPGQPY